MIEVISEIVPKNKQDFVIVDSSNIRGGFYQLNTLDELKSISTDHFKEGMLVYIKEDSAHTYQWINGKWEIAKIGYNTAVVVDNESELNNSIGESLGQIAYVKNTNTILVYGVSGWSHLESITVSTTEPSDKNVIWIDPNGDSKINEEGNLGIIREQISTLQKQVNQLLKIINYGVIAGDATIGGRTKIMETATPINPNDPDDIPPIIEPDKKPLQYTVPNLSIKYDTLANFKKNTQNLLNGEPIWITDKNGMYVYLNGIFRPVSSGGGSEQGDDMTQDDIEKLYFTHLGFTDTAENKYSLSVNENGVMQVFNTANYDNNIGNIDDYGSYISSLLCINSIFIGGIGTKLDSYCAATHNYVELSNASGTDINLNGIHLLYKRPGEIIWEDLPLKGFIKNGGTFLIRGARCSYKSNLTLDVNEYDLQWYDSKGNLIEFSEGGGCFYLVCSQENKFYHRNKKAWVSLEEFGDCEPFIADKNELPIGYIDLVGIKGNTTYTITAEGGSPIVLDSSVNIKRCIFVRSMVLDPCKQSRKNLSKRKNNVTVTYVNMDIKGTEIEPYYSTELKAKLTPKASFSNKNIFSTRSTFDEKAPNMVNVTFGINALATSDKGATRCFNWVSVGYYDEYVEYKLKEESWENAKQIESISEETLQTTYSKDPLLTSIYKDSVKLSDLYKRIKWVTTNKTSVTTHKVILRDLREGIYEYRVRRYEDDSYISPIKSFTVRNEASCSNFNFIQTTDQQAFNYMEYQAWAKACWAIKKNDGDNLHFTINTGDMTQNGNRENEWIDYYDGRSYLDSIEEMVTIGNNDLCGKVPYELGNGEASIYKINHKNIEYYYTFEIDPNNPPIFKFINNTPLLENLLGNVLWHDSTSFYYLLPSLYSFNYGAFHFICLNSEFADNTYSVYYNDVNVSGSMKAHAYYNMFKWLEKDCATYTGKHFFAYMHELPLHITPKASSTSPIAAARSMTNGSKLNLDFTLGIKYSDVIEDPNNYIGGCCYSEFFESHNIKLVCGGHKHTYSLSYPTKENIKNSRYNKITINTTFSTIPETNPSNIEYILVNGIYYKWIENSYQKINIIEKSDIPTKAPYDTYIKVGETYYEFLVRTVDYNHPIIDTMGEDGVTYAMCQATGYKLISNKELPGRDIPWLRTYMEVDTEGNANIGQFSPMYSVYKVKNIGPNKDEITFSTKQVKNIYGANGSKPVNFDINKQYKDFITTNSIVLPLKNDITEIKISYNGNSKEI